MSVELLYKLSDEETPPINNDVELTENAQQRLLSASKWMNFLSILSFVFMGLVVLFLPILWVAPNTQTSTYSDENFASHKKAIIIGLVIGLIIFFWLTILFYKTAQNIKRGIFFKDGQTIELALAQQKKLFKYIVVISVLSFVISFIYSISLRKF